MTQAMYGDYRDARGVVKGTLPAEIAIRLGRGGEVDAMLDWLRANHPCDQVLINYHVGDMAAMHLDETERCYVRCVPVRHNEPGIGRGPTLEAALVDAIRSLTATS